MLLTRLTLTDFRSYATASIEPGPGFIVLTGDNGAGKTNILEAVSLFAPGRGLRGAALGDMARKQGQGGFSVSALLKPLPFRSGVGVGKICHDDSQTVRGQTIPTSSPSPQGDEGISLGTGTIAAAPERRIVRINGAAASATAVSEWLSIIWLTPAHDRLFSGTPGERRRFLDRLVLALHPGHAHHSTRYDAAMRQRNRLLADDRMDEVWLKTLESAMEDHGTHIQRARIDMVNALMAQGTGSTDASFPSFRIMLTNIVTDGLAGRLAAGRTLHASAGRTLAGPHTQDMEVHYAAKSQPAAQSSTGEQKALLLGIILAHADLVTDAVQRRPILLLDEVAAHLDPRRRMALFERLDSSGGQVWLTGTEPALFRAVPSSATCYTVADGTVRRCDPAAIAAPHP